MNKKFLCNGFVGWHTTSVDKDYSHDLLARMTQGLFTSLSCQSLYFPTHACSSTSDVSLFNDTGTACIIGNPIWKDDTLRRLSIEKGHTAAMIDAYSKHAEDFLSKLSGDFSLILIDPNNNIFFAAVDHLNRYPLYYSVFNETVVFSSSASALLCHDEIDSKISHQGLYNYIYFHMSPSPTSVYQGINKLQAGEVIKIKDKNVTVERYWLPKFHHSPEKRINSLTHKLKPLLKEAVAKSLSSDKKTGAFLSGGLDSSTVVGMLSEIKNHDVDAFSIGFDADGYDEMEFARITADHFGIRLHEYYVTPDDVVNTLPLIAKSYDEPFGNSSALPAYFCAKFAREKGMECLLAGDGGDEIFAGNERYSKQKVFEAYQHIPSWMRSRVIEPILMQLPESNRLVSKAQSYIRQSNINLPDRLQSYNFLHRHAIENIFTEGFISIINTDIPLNYQRNIYNQPEEASSLNRMLYLDWQYTLADNDLRKVSHMCALAGIDVRYPMLDDELLDFSCELPEKWKLKGQNLRYFFKESLRGWLPDQTISKKKQGFGLPFGVWMQTYNPLQELAYDSLSALKTRNILKPDFIDHVVNLHRNKHASYYGELVWILTVLELWMSEHCSQY